MGNFQKKNKKKTIPVQRKLLNRARVAMGITKQVPFTIINAQAIGG